MNLQGLFKDFEQGMLSFPDTIWHGIERTGQDVGLEGITSFEQAWGQNWRLLVLLEKTIKYGALGGKHSPLIAAIIIIIEHYYEALPQPEKNRINDKIKRELAIKAGKFSAGALFSVFIAKKIARQVVVNSFIRRLAKNAIKGIGTILSIQGMIYSSAQASDRLQHQYPRIYLKMKSNNLDMLYFLLEKPLHKYLLVIKRNELK